MNKPTGKDKRMNFAIGQKVYHYRCGRGIIKKIVEGDEFNNYTSEILLHCKDGTRIWCREKDISLVSSNYEKYWAKKNKI